MARTREQKIESLLEQEDWENAQKAIQRELIHHPEDHWLHTQLGVSLYEQGRYEESLQPLLGSLDIVPDCPLTLWNLAGALDAIGKPLDAVPIYSWLLKSKKTPADDTCWESEEWTSALKTDCVYRVGACFEKLKKWPSAENCFRQYINLLLAGMQGTYSLDDAAGHIRRIQELSPPRPDRLVRDAFASTLNDFGIQSVPGRGRRLPKLSLAKLLST
jgi:tetratricopeptide (TPR) repeat protein